MTDAWTLNDLSNDLWEQEQVARRERDRLGMAAGYGERLSLTEKVEAARDARQAVDELLLSAEW